MSDRRDDALVGSGLGALGLSTQSYKIVDRSRARRRNALDTKINNAQSRLNDKTRRRPHGGKPWSINDQGLRGPAARRKALEGRGKSIKRTQGELDGLRRERKLIGRHGRVPGRIGANATAAFGVGATWYGARHRVEKYDRRDADSAAAGGLAGHAAYRGVEYGTKGIDRRAARRIDADPKMRAELKAHRAKHGISPDTPKGDPRWQGFFRDYPEHLPAARFKRTLAHTHSGRSGVAVGAGTIVAGMGGGVAANRHVRKFDRHDAETATGAGIAGLYGPRLKMVGPGIAAGAKYAEEAGDTRRRDALVALEGRRRQFLTGTEPLVRKLPRELSHFRRTSVLGGLALAAHGHRQSQPPRPPRPVRGRPVYGW